MEKNNLIKQLVELNQQVKKTWTPGVDYVQYAGPWFDESEYINAITTLLNHWLVLGPDAKRFEERFSKLFNKKYGLLVNSGSSANLLMMAAIKSLFKLKPSDKIITPIAGFPTTVNPILQLGLTPVFVDIELESLNIDIKQLEHILQADFKREIKAITFAHVLGNPPNMDEIMRLVKEYDLLLLEDCCDALGSTYKNQPLGSYGILSTCSFYPAHHITMGEGGIVTTNDFELERTVRSLRDWGRACYCEGKENLEEHGKCQCRFSPWLKAFPDDSFDHKYVYNEIGYNLKPIELQASIGLAQLDKLDKIKEIRSRNHSLLYNIFEKYSEYFILPKATEGSDPSWFAFALTIKDNADFTRSELCEYLESNKIQTRQYFGGNLMLQPAYEHLMLTEDAMINYPNATKITKDTFFLGVSPVISEEQIKYIGTVIDKFFTK